MVLSISRRALIAATLAGGVAFAVPAHAQVTSLELLAPSNPGSGWDQTARALQEVMQAEGLASGIQVVNVGGGGGTIGLAQFVTSAGNRGDYLLLTGLAMVSGELINMSEVTLDEVRPLARIMGEYEVIVVPAASPIENLGQLIEQLKADPGSVSWGAGSAGSADHLLVGLIAAATEVPATGINYIGHSGGGEALAAILGGHVTVGLSGYGEFASQIEAGELRALGISAPERVEGLDIPTFIEQGLDVDFVNWRGIVAPKDISDADFETLATLMDTLLTSDAWQAALDQRGWLGLYLPAAEFEPFLAENRAETEEVLRSIGLVE
jgi:putative tricarboxylic transport membrane protein